MFIQIKKVFTCLCYYYLGDSVGCAHSRSAVKRSLFRTCYSFVALWLNCSSSPGYLTKVGVAEKK